MDLVNFLQRKCVGLERKRNCMGVVAFMFAGMALLVLTNPPGGFVQATVPSDKFHVVPALFIDKQDEYKFYSTSIAMSMYSSFCVAFLLLSGVPLKNEITMKILSVATALFVMFHVLAFYFGFVLFRAWLGRVICAISGAARAFS